MTEEQICFVIAPIGPDGSDIRKRSDQVYRHIIEPVATECGYTAIRADKIPAPGVITNQIIEHLLNDDVVVADLAGHNPNVFYELAVRHAIRKPVLLLAKHGENIPFDIAQNRAIFIDHQDLDSVEECKAELKRQFETVKNNPDAVDSPISTAIDRRAMRTSGNPVEKSLAEILERMEAIEAQLNRSQIHPGRQSRISMFMEEYSDLARYSIRIKEKLAAIQSQLDTLPEDSEWKDTLLEEKTHLETTAIEISARMDVLEHERQSLIPRRPTTLPES